MKVQYGNLSQWFVLGFGQDSEKKKKYVWTGSNSLVLSNSFTGSDMQVNSCERKQYFR
jgi:hypothetical protein